MNKLTAEKCREQFEEWLKSTGQNPPYATKRGYWEIWKASREALEIALPILDQHKVDSEALAVSREIMKIMYGPMPKGGSVQLMAQVQCLVIDAMKVAQGDNSPSRQQERGEGGWIEWKGGLVPPVTGLVEVRYRNGREHSGCKASDYSWTLGLGGLTIIAYRIIPEVK